MSTTSSRLTKWLTVAISGFKEIMRLDLQFTGTTFTIQQALTKLTTHNQLFLLLLLLQTFLMRVMSQRGAVT